MRCGAVGAGAYPGAVTVLRYSLLRLLLLFGCMLVLWLVGVRNPVLLLLATAVSSIALSYVVLRGPREALARDLADHVDQRLARSNRDADAEDAEIDRRPEDNPPPV